MKSSFLLISNTEQTRWLIILREVIQGMVHVVSEEKVPEIAPNQYSMIFIDAGEVSNEISLSMALRTRHPSAKIIIATASPTWQRARQAFRAGAVDYISKSLSEKKLRRRIKDILSLPPQPCMPQVPDNKE